MLVGHRSAFPAVGFGPRTRRGGYTTVVVSSNDKRVAIRDSTQLFTKNVPDLSPKLFGGLAMVFLVTVRLLVHFPRMLHPAW